MRKSLNQDQMREIADLFASVMPSDTKRDAILALAFSRYPKMLGSIDRSGAGFIFSVNLIAFLHQRADRADFRWHTLCKSSRLHRLPANCHHAANG